MKTPFHFTPLHIYRDILRQASYHPDPKARQWLKQYAISSFHDGKRSDGDLTGIGNTPSTATNNWRWRSEADQGRRETALHSRARKFLVLLRKANNGSAEHFRRTLKLVYGRQGPKRHDLMRPFLQLQPESTSAPQSTTTFSGLSPSAEFLKLANHQSPMQNQIMDRTRKLSPTGPPSKLPETTIWGRPTPRKRFEKKAREWYAHEAATLYPPLSRTQWTYVRDIAVGRRSLSWPAHRKPGKLGILTTVDADEAITGSKINFLAPLNRTIKALHNSSSSTDAENPSSSTQHIRPRWFRRQYAHLLRHSPVAVFEKTDPSSQAQPPEDPSQVNKHLLDQTAISDEAKPKPTTPGAYLWEDFYQKTSLVKGKVGDEGVRKLLFG